MAHNGHEEGVVMHSKASLRSTGTHISFWIRFWIKELMLNPVSDGEKDTINGYFLVWRQSDTCNTPHEKHQTCTASSRDAIKSHYLWNPYSLR